MNTSVGRNRLDLSRRLIIEAGQRYWPNAAEPVEVLARDLPAQTFNGAYRGLAEVPLPAWAADLGVGTPASLLVDARALMAGEGPAFARCDWFAAAAAMLWSLAEREHEERSGPIHSYALRLSVDPRAFDHAWVNRILLLIRRMAARTLNVDEQATFGPLPTARITVTHDLDAIERLPELRLKQAAFQVINAGRLAARLALRQAASRLGSASASLFASRDLWAFDDLTAMTARRGVQTRIHVYAGPPGWRRRWPALLMDPGYDVADPRLSDALRRLQDAGHEVGLHPAFASWRDTANIAIERKRLESALGAAVSSCRQHWLRFSFADTWRAQVAAGLARDSTLGFNDRPGFRNSAALAFAPVDTRDLKAVGTVAEPMILMDSHVYDYDLGLSDTPEERMEPWIAEVRAVRGEATVLWHPHTLHPAYGWRAGFEALLEMIAAR